MKKIITLLITGILLTAFFSIGIVYEEDKSYFEKCIIILKKKKFFDFSIIDLLIIKIWEQKSSEELIQKQLNAEIDHTKTYYTGCGGGEILLETQAEDILE